MVWALMKRAGPLLLNPGCTLESPEEFLTHSDAEALPRQLHQNLWGWCPGDSVQSMRTEVDSDGHEDSDLGHQAPADGLGVLFRLRMS